jgi:hypothetical protein
MLKKKKTLPASVLICGSHLGAQSSKKSNPRTAGFQPFINVQKV